MTGCKTWVVRRQLPISRKESSAGTISRCSRRSTVMEILGLPDLMERLAQSLFPFWATPAPTGLPEFAVLLSPWMEALVDRAILEGLRDQPEGVAMARMVNPVSRSRGQFPISTLILGFSSRMAVEEAREAMEAPVHKVVRVALEVMGAMERTVHVIRGDPVMAVIPDVAVPPATVETLAQEATARVAVMRPL
jgi:hypothetical protein